jgi:hypothetical protein
MPRRTKLLITAVFLVLLAIPMGYVALTWTPRSPPHFRYLGQGEPEMRQHDLLEPTEKLMIPIRFEVGNPSYIPLFVQRGAWSFKDSQSMSDEVFVDFLYAQVIPAGGVVRGQAYATPEQVRSIVGKEMVMYCEWATVTRRRAKRLLEKAAHRLESSLLYEMSVPGMMFDAIPVEDASTAPNASDVSTSPAP